MRASTWTWAQAVLSIVWSGTVGCVSLEDEPGTGLTAASGGGGAKADGGADSSSTAGTSGAEQVGGGTTGSGDGGSNGDGGGWQGPSPGNVWFHEPFEALGPEERYGFNFRRQPSPSTWQTDHQPSGGFGGTGGAHVRVTPCAGCDTHTNQYSIGWVTPDLASVGKPTSAIGDGLYVRWRIRFDKDTRWTENTPFKHSAKFVLFGETGNEPNSRVILHLFNPYENGGCSPGFEYYDPWPESEWVRTEDWGLGPIGWDHPALSGHFGAFTAHVNIGWDCAPGVLVTHAASPYPLAPQHVGAAPIDGWYHLQFFIKSGDGDAEFRIWANNNDEATPSSRRAGFSLHTVGWDGGLDFGGYWGIGSGNAMGFVVDDLEVGDTFHPGWYPEP